MIGLPEERKHKGRLPLHLLYRFDRPGAYEVRLTRVDNLFGPAKTLAVSEWTPIGVLAAPPGRRAEWLAELNRQSQWDAVALVEDLLPSVLGVPDEASLALVEPYLYHPEPLVRRFTALGLGYWPEVERKAAAMRLLRERGPTDVTAGLLRDQREAAVQAALPYLRSASPVLLTGAITLLRSLALDSEARPGAALRSRVAAALVEAADHIRETADLQARNDYAAILGGIHTAPAHETLWQWIDADIARGQAVVAVTWHGDPLDLPRLAKLFDPPVADERASDLSSLPYALRRSYGDDALPYLERALGHSAAVSVRTNCARELALAGRPAGFDFIADAIENDRSHKAEMTRFVRERFAEMRSASEAEVLIFVKQRGAAR